MDGVFNSGNILKYLVMDNDSGYGSNNFGQKSNSGSISETLNNSSVEILKSLLPKSVYISEDALSECPDLDQTINVPRQEECNQDFRSLPFSQDNEVTSIVGKCGASPYFNSFQSDSGSSTPSIVVAEPIYYNLSTNVNSSTFAPNDYENISSNPSDEPFFGYENVSMEASNVAHRNCSDILTKETVQTEVKLNSLLLGFFGYNQKSSDTIETIKTSDEETNFLVEQRPIAIKEPIPVENSVLTNVTNTGVCSYNEASTSKLSILPHRNSIENKENSTKPEVFKTLSKCRKRKYSEIGSPDLFPDDQSNKTGHPVTSKETEEKKIFQ